MEVVYLMAIALILVLCAYLRFAKPLEIPTPKGASCNSGQMCPIPKGK